MVMLEIAAFRKMSVKDFGLGLHHAAGNTICCHFTGR
jgi:hypothetical protein